MKLVGRGDTTVVDAYTDDDQYAFTDDGQYAFADDEGDAFVDAAPADEAALSDITDQHVAIDWTTAEPGYLDAEPAEAGPWRRTDDDLLPKSSGRRRFGRR